MEKKIVIKIDNASVQFNKSIEHISGLKDYVIKLLKRELMFQQFFALKNIDLQIRQGESWGIIGKNGSGKSTLLKLISGILKPYEGTVTVIGSISPLIELGAGFDSELTARENIFLNGTLLGYSKEFIKKEFNNIIDFADIGNFLDTPIKNFSSGMSARLGFAIATISKPDILIVDEVLAVGDFEFQKKCNKKMEELLNDGTTLLFVSHSIEQVKKLCKNAIWIDKGEIKATGNVSDVSKLYIQQ